MGEEIILIKKFAGSAKTPPIQQPGYMKNGSALTAVQT